jgi:hypothetical protein
MRQIVLLGNISILLAVGSACGKTDEVSSTTTGNLKSNPLAGASQGSILNKLSYFASLDQFLALTMFGLKNANAAVTTFNTFKVCVSEIVYETQSGSAGSPNTPLKPGLLDFSPTSTEAMTIGTLDITSGTVLKNIKFTIATKPELCSSADYAVLFNAGSSGDKKVTQDMSFQFDFASGGYTFQSGQTVTLYLGDIVNGMATLGSGLNNTTIQTVDVGQAK